MFKFLDSRGCTYYDGKPFVYNLPRRGEKWAKTEHPSPATVCDGRACGPGGLHAMKRLDATHAPPHWGVWYCRGVGLHLGEDEEKIRNTVLELRRIPKRVLWRALRPPFNWGCRTDLHGADLHRAKLREADLSRTNLRDADLRGADLCKANLHKADLRRARLCGADLRWANLSEADLHNADLHLANLSGADLCGANLRGANLCGVNLHDVNLSGASLDSTIEILWGGH